MAALMVLHHCDWHHWRWWWRRERKVFKISTYLLPFRSLLFVAGQNRAQASETKNRARKNCTILPPPQPTHWNDGGKSGCFFSDRSERFWQEIIFFPYFYWARCWRAEFHEKMLLLLEISCFGSEQSEEVGREVISFITRQKFEWSSYVSRYYKMVRAFLSRKTESILFWLSG